MKFVRGTFRFVFLTINIIIGIGFLICAYSPIVPPTQHPVWACTGLFIPIFIILNLCFLVFWSFFWWRLLPVPIVFFLLGWSSLMSYCPLNLPSGNPVGEVVDVLTYNVMLMKSQKTADGNYENPILDYIKECDADIVCLQEFPFNDSKIKDSILCIYPYMRICEFNHLNAVACLSKYPVRFVEAIKMDSRYNGSAVFSVEYKGKNIPVIVNHLESNKLDAHDKEIYTEMIKSPDGNRMKKGGKHLIKKLAEAVSIRGLQADVISEYIEKKYSPYMIVCGDFNDTPVSYVHDRISEKLQDAYIEAGNGPGITYNRNFLYFRIDHIMAGDAYRVLECEVDNSMDVSDHYPLKCRLEIKVSPRRKTS